MSINVALAREIYGLTPWSVDQYTLPSFLSILNNHSNGVKLEIPTQKYNSVGIIKTGSTETVFVEDLRQLDTSETFQAIGVVHLDGPITVSGGMSSYGTRYLAEQIDVMASDERIKDIIVSGDSGGGATLAVEIMADAINRAKKVKKVYGHIKVGGICASACFGIMSACDVLYAASEMSIVGSAGTMMQFQGRKANSGEEDGDLYKQVRVYAPESVRKNKGFEDAIQNDDFSFLIDEVLKPVNQRFLSLIESNRPQLKGTDFRDGRVVFAKDGIGTFIDGIKSLQEVVDEAMSETAGPKPINLGNTNSTTDSAKNNNVNNVNNMTKAELKNAYPGLYSEIVQEGVSQELDRAGSWLQHVETDPSAVREGILSGEAISQTKREEFFVKQNSKKEALDMVSGSAKEFDTAASRDVTKETEKTEAQKAKEQELKAAFDFELK